MRNAAERITTMRGLRIRTGVGIACAALTLTAASCGTDSEGSTTNTTSATSSGSTASPVAYDYGHAYTEAEKAILASREHDFNTPIPDDVEWATSTFRKAYNDEVAEYKDLGVTQKGKIKTTAVEPAESNPDAAGGWDLTMYACTTSTVRVFDEDGKDVTGDPDTGEPLPNKPQKGVDLVSLTTPDDGKTWQVDNVQMLSGKDAKEASCAG